MTKKLIILEIRSPYLNSVVVPAKFGTFSVSAARLPAGRKRPMKGSIISLTNAFTSAEAACPITNAIASPMIPKVFKKKKNSCVKDRFSSGLAVINGDTSTMTSIKEFA